MLLPCGSEAREGSRPGSKQGGRLPAPQQQHCTPHQAHPPSMGRPEPLNTRPSWSRDTGVRSTCGQQVGGGGCSRGRWAAAKQGGRLHPHQQLYAAPPASTSPPSQPFPAPCVLDPFTCLTLRILFATLTTKHTAPPPSPPPLTSPVNSSVVLRLSMPVVPSNTCTTARSPSTSSTCPRRMLPSPSRRFTISAYLGFCGGADQPSVEAKAGQR